MVNMIFLQVPVPAQSLHSVSPTKRTELIIEILWAFISAIYWVNSEVLLPVRKPRFWDTRVEVVTRLEGMITMTIHLLINPWSESG